MHSGNIWHCNNVSRREERLEIVGKKWKGLGVEVRKERSNNFRMKHLGIWPMRKMLG